MWSGRDGPAVRRTGDGSLLSQLVQGGGEGLVADLEEGAQLFLGEGFVVVGEGADDLLREGVVPRCGGRCGGSGGRVIVDAEMDRIVVVEG